MLTVAEALKQIQESLSPIAPESVPITEAHQRICRQELRARENSPLFDNSAMDGYALKAEDTLSASKTAPVSLKIIDKIPAGTIASSELSAGEACRILTGAPTPKGANAVIMQEDTEVQGDIVAIHREVACKENVRFAGEDITTDEILYESGDVLDAGAIGVLAAQGFTEILVGPKPKVAVIPTGDEIVELGQKLEPGQIRNSNAHMLAAQIERSGANATQGAIACDTLDALRQTLNESAKGSDLIITCGGVSVGEFDLVRNIVESEGQKVFWKVAVKPGKPLLFGYFRDTPLIGLPGNPVSAFVCFELFVRPAIEKLMGEKQNQNQFCSATLTQSVKPNKKRTEYLRGVYQIKNGEACVEPHLKQGSGHLRSITHINTLIEIPPGNEVLQTGTRVKIIILKN
ncbi:MAG: hypothetical protein CMH60_07465 [Myxococcales bacterium]|nr:hypothetical protein [Myxococcales bacterium]